MTLTLATQSTFGNLLVSRLVADIRIQFLHIHPHSAGLTVCRPLFRTLPTHQYRYTQKKNGYNQRKAFAAAAMICLSKADEAALRHLSYNQSPRPLAPEHTTRQDLNGISNIREHVAADQDDDAGGGGSLGSGDADEKWYHQGPSPGHGLPLAMDAGRWYCGKLPLTSSKITMEHRHADFCRTVLASQGGWW